MGDRRRRSRAMEMAQYQARLDIEDSELINAEAELVNSFMQYEHHGESSHRGSVTGRSFVQRDREECHDQMMKDYFIERLRFPAHDFQRRFRMRRELFEANGCSTNSTDEYCRLAESIAIENLKCFCQAIQAIYGATYLRKPTRENLKRLLRKADKKRLPWHDRKSRFWSTFVKSFSHPDNAKKKLFSQRQESYRKDVEKAFRILQARWVIVRGLARFWQPKDLHSIMMTCIILHNMIVEDEYIEIEEDSDEDVDDDQLTHARAIARNVEYLAPTTYETRHDRVTLGEYMRCLNRIQAPQIHDTLRKDLVEHVWRLKGER
ncbi:uncharacterized protein [Malus domestica]|uniref:uncharacterized protein n=1 Tax=Malus domestica TaxID=3750 RepID=UPI0039763636